MDEKEKKELIDKILSVEKDSKLARVSATVFINKATKEEGKFFLDYLSHHSSNLKKLARSIVSQLGVAEAFELLIQEFESVVASLTFYPDSELADSNYYANLIEIMETIFTVARVENLKNDKFLARIDDLFKRTKNEDIRFTLIKLIGLLGDKFDFFMLIFKDLSEKERRALYYVYSVVNHPKRMELYKKGLEDEKNLEYVVLSLLSFPEGRIMLSQEFLSFTNYHKQIVLKKLQDGKYPEFIDVLTRILSDKNKLLSEMAVEVLKNNLNNDEAIKPFITILETGYSAEGVSGALEIISHCVKKNQEDIYLQALDIQPSAKNKDIILEFFIEQLKGKIRITEELGEKIIPKLIIHFDNYAKDKEDLYLSIFKLIPMLRYSNANMLRALRKKIIQFKKDFESRMPGPFKNNIGEFVVKLNQLASRFDESEAKVKNILILFDLDPQKIEHTRMMKLKDQLQEIESFEDQHKLRLMEFLVKLLDAPRIDWKVKSVAVELLGDYGRTNEIAKLMEVVDKESSLAVKVNAQKAIKKIEERHAAIMSYVLILEPLPYIQKKLVEFFKAHAFKTVVINEIEKFNEISQIPFKFLIISESIMINDEFTQRVFDFLDENFESTLVIVTANPDLLDPFRDIPNVKFLKKPFNDEQLIEIIEQV